MSALLEKLPSPDEIQVEKARRAKVRVLSVSPHDIDAWFRDVLNFHLYPKQLEMVEALRDHDQVSVAGCNSSGKDATAARIALWWMKIHDGQAAKVVITGPTFRQIQQVVWQELRTAYLYGADALGGHLYEAPYCRWDEQRFIVGFSTDKPYQLQGYHSPHLLIIVTEAHGVAQSHMDVLWRLNPNKVLLTGNPISESGEFYDSHHSKSHLWHTINIDAFDTPNVVEGREVVPGLVTREDIERHKRNWGEDSPLYRMTVLNEWVEGMGSLVVVPLSWAKAAEAAEHIAGPIEVVACDIAEYGTDETVIVSRRGRVVRVLMRIQGQDLMQTTGYIKAYHDAHKHAHIVVDGVGVGAGVVSRLRELNVGVIRFMGGESASDSSQYENLNAEVWWRMREAYAKGLDVEEDSLLRSEVSSRKYTIQSDKRIKLESKKDMRKAGRKSPDTADSVAMSFMVDYQIDGERLTAGSNLDGREDAIPAMQGFGNQHDRPSADAMRRGSDLAPATGSRWGKVRKGYRR